jgi:hypothetical protein
MRGESASIVVIAGANCAVGHRLSCSVPHPTEGQRRSTNSSAARSARGLEANLMSYVTLL